MKKAEKTVSAIAGAVSQLTAAAQEVNGLIRQCDAELESLYVERELMTDGALPKADYLQHVAAEIARKGERFRLNMVGAVERSRRSFRLMSGPPEVSANRLQDRRFSPFFVESTDVRRFEEMLCFYCGDSMVERLGQALDAVTWPASATPESARPARIEAIDKEIAAVQARRDDIVQMLEASGVSG